MTKVYNHRTRAVITNPKGQILVLIRNFRKQAGRSHPIVMLPGGGVDEGETSEEGLRREVMEECGLEIFDVSFFWKFKETRPLKFPESEYWHGADLINNEFDFYRAETQTTKTPSLLEPDKFDDVSWIQLTDIEAYANKHRAVEIGDGILQAAKRLTSERKGLIAW